MQPTLRFHLEFIMIAESNVSSRNWILTCWFVYWSTPYSDNNRQYLYDDILLHKLPLCEVLNHVPNWKEHYICQCPEQPCAASSWYTEERNRRFGSSQNSCVLLHDIQRRGGHDLAVAAAHLSSVEPRFSISLFTSAISSCNLCEGEQWYTGTLGADRGTEGVLHKYKITKALWVSALVSALGKIKHNLQTLKNICRTFHFLLRQPPLNKQLEWEGVFLFIITSMIHVIKW